MIMYFPYYLFRDIRIVNDEASIMILAKVCNIDIIDYLEDDEYASFDICGLYQDIKKFVMCMLSVKEEVEFNVVCRRNGFINWANMLKYSIAE